MTATATASNVLTHLTGPGAARVMARLLPAGARLGRLTPKHVGGRPPGRVTVRYDAVVRGPDGRDRKEILVAAYGPLPDGVATTIVAGERVALWRVAEDPSLPGLAAVFDSSRLAALFEAEGLRGGGFTAKLRSYIPEQRAVFEVTSTGAAGERVFIKVLPPDEARRLVAIHERLRGAVPVPEAQLLDTAGAVVISTVEGRTLFEALQEAPEQAPPPADVVALSSAIAAVALDRTVTGREQRIDPLQASFDIILPAESARVRSILAAPLEPQPPVGVHGDFHPKQLLVRDGAITGVLDVDGAGMGAQADDLATQLAWLAVAADEKGIDAFARYEDDLRTVAGSVVDPDEVGRRAAIAVLTRALVPYQRALPDWKPRALSRIALAERLSRVG